MKGPLGWYDTGVVRDLGTLIEWRNKAVFLSLFTCEVLLYLRVVETYSERPMHWF